MDQAKPTWCGERRSKMRITSRKMIKSKRRIKSRTLRRRREKAREKE